MRRQGLALAALGLALHAAPALPDGTGGAGDGAPHEVRVSKARPERDRPATLRFLSENRAFLRASLDALRERRRDGRGSGAEIDPRHVAYRDFLAEIHAARDSVATSEAVRRGRELLAHVGDLSKLEAELDLMERALAAQRVRLGVLQSGFAGDQLTALMVVVSGDPQGAAVSEISVQLEDGGPVVLPLSVEQTESLRRGGVVQLFHGRVEPRAQVVQVRVAGDRWPAGDAGYVTLEPPRDRLFMLRLDLTGVGPAQGATGIRATSWLHEATLPDREG